MENIAVIDLGSNSARMAVFSCEPDGKWKALVQLRETVRLAQGAENGYLRRETMEKVAKVLEKFRFAALAAGCGEIIAVTTQAVRAAKNQEEFLSLAREKAGIDLRVLSGEEEAEFSFTAARETLPIDSGIIFDTGGGSTEIMLVKNRELVKSASLPCGAVVLTESCPEGELCERARVLIEGLDWLKEAHGMPLYGIGGSAKALAFLCGKTFPSIDAVNGFEISRKTIDKIYEKIAATPAEKRAEIRGMDKSRADIILAGLTPLKVMAEMLESPKMVVCAYGVREGVFFKRKNEIIKGAPNLNIVLVEPEIPQNTGNIARTCAAAGARLHLVKPLGFEISDKALKRAGLDYWNLLDVKYYENLDEFFEKNSGGRFFYATTKGGKCCAEAEFRKGDYILFGKETKGLPEDILRKNPERCVRIPMSAAARSLNLGNSAAILIYEALRQNNFMNLEQTSNFLTEEQL